MNRRKLFLSLMVLVAASLALAGCTLSGTGAVPLTPPEEMAGALFPTPTEMTSPDVFATQTMQSQSALQPAATVEGEPSGGAATEVTEDEEPAEEATAEATGQPEEEPAEEPEEETETADCEYVIESGDTLFNIALLYDLTVEEIAEASGIIDTDTLDIGDVLIIPNCGRTGTGSVSPSAGTGSGSVYIVQPGDNLFRIALSYGIDWEDLAAYNGITDPTSLTIGQEILIP